MEQEEVLSRAFLGVWIPRGIYLNKDLSWDEKILLIEIESLDKGTGCFASNKYLAAFINVSEGTLANKMTKLRRLGLIVDKGFDGRTRLIGVNSEFTNLGTQGSLNNEGTLHGIMNKFVKENPIKPNKKAPKTTKKSVGDIQYRDKEEITPPYKSPQGGTVESTDQSNQTSQPREKIETSNQSLDGTSSLVGVAMADQTVPPETGVADLSTNHQLEESKKTGKAINDVLAVFYKKNPHIPFGKPSERKAAEDVIKIHGIEDAIKIAEYAISLNSTPYAPVITSATQLKAKLPALKAYYDRTRAIETQKEERAKLIFGKSYDKVKETFKLMDKTK